MFLLTACGGSTTPKAGGSSGGSAKAAAGLPKVSGSYGDKPTLTFPSPTPPAGVQKQILRQGTGPAVAKGDLLVADYLGQVWNGAVFDNSYDRKMPAGFPIGVGQVIPGWDQTLVGVKAGSRVLLSIPPAEGYGSQGNTQANIKGTDTLAFVVDVVSSYSKASVGDPHAKVDQKPAKGVTVTGALGKAPTVAIAKGTPAPKVVAGQVLARGSGPLITGGVLIVQVQAVDYSGKPAGSTWTVGTPAAASVSPTGSSMVFDVTRGVPLGSRVLIEVPAQGTQPAIAAVADLIAQPKTAKATG
ncbi:MAG TPA: FKBP-type peptidyl-prolyl cis-trans isomerase [Mycobacteriales bacterium]|nr:FKBP-type peptidyl-prolyl cis-trans isomerase [Mycobacteriales bacterium]